MRERAPIQLPPGVSRAGSEAEMAGRWYETQLVRWVEGVMRPVNGWEKILFETPSQSVTTFDPAQAQPARRAVERQPDDDPDGADRLRSTTPWHARPGPRAQASGSWR